MSWDRVRIFNGVDGESTLVSADKTAHTTLFSGKFKDFARECGFALRAVIDESDTAGEHARAIEQLHAQPVALPDAAKEEWYGRMVAQKPLLEFRPPINEAMTSMMAVYFKVFSEPSDAAIMIDHRDETPSEIASW